ncbi:hypothetical protein D3C79_1043800 [compost metagenome]
MVGCCAVRHAACAGGIIKGQLLAEQRADNTGKHIAHSAARHASIARIHDAKPAGFTGDDSACPFQNRNTTVTFYQTLSRM